MKSIREIQHNGLLWVNVNKQGEKELKTIEKRFHFADTDLKESLPPYQRPKMVKRDGYYFLILHFPIFDRQTMRLGFTEVDFFLNSSYLVTVHDNQLPIIEDFFSAFGKDGAAKAIFSQGTAAQLLLELLNRLVEAIFPILLHVNEDINLVDKRLFGTMPDREMAEEILRLKTNIVTFRRTMQGHRSVLERLVMYGDHDLNLVAMHSLISGLRESATEIWHMLESQKESINALHETNESIVSLRTTHVMRTLTIISVITFPLTLVATLFSIQAQGTPFLHYPGGFWIIVGLIVAGALGLVAIFKKRRWL